MCRPRTLQVHRSQLAQWGVGLQPRAAGRPKPCFSLVMIFVGRKSASDLLEELPQRRSPQLVGPAEAPSTRRHGVVEHRKRDIDARASHIRVTFGRSLSASVNWKSSASMRLMRRRPAWLATASACVACGRADPRCAGSPAEHGREAQALQQVVALIALGHRLRGLRRRSSAPCGAMRYDRVRQAARQGLDHGTCEGGSGMPS